MCVCVCVCGELIRETLKHVSQKKCRITREGPRERTVGKRETSEETVTLKPPVF